MDYVSFKGWYYACSVLDSISQVVYLTHTFHFLYNSDTLTIELHYFEQVYNDITCFHGRNNENTVSMKSLDEDLITYSSKRISILVLQWIRKDM